MDAGYRYKIHGHDIQLLELELRPGQSILAETGAMQFYDQGIEMQSQIHGGVLSGLSRKITGESFFVANFTNQTGEPKRIGFAAEFPGEILPLSLAKLGGELICQRNAFLCASTDISLSVHLAKRLGAGLFGGEGFILQKLTGSGAVFINAGGALYGRNLAHGETVLVDTGCLAAFTGTVDFSVSFVRGVRNLLFGGEGMFLASLTGPGRVYIQSLPVDRLTRAIARRTRMMRQLQAGRPRSDHS